MICCHEQENRKRAIIIAEDIDLRVLTALEYTRTISEDIIVFAIFANPEDEQTLHVRWSEIKPAIPLVLCYSQDGGITAPLLEFLQTPEYGLGDDEIVTIFLPRLVETKWWHRLLDNHVSKYIERTLSAYQQIQVEVVPVQLQDDDLALGNEAQREDFSCRF